MSHQLTFADSEFSTKRRQTRKEIFLSRMEQILPWQNMVEVIEPFYPKAGNGRRPYPLETMLRIHCMQHWYSMTSISWVICFMERSNLSQPMPATKERHSARSWPRWMWTG